MEFQDGAVGYAIDESGELDVLFQVTGHPLRTMDVERAVSMRDALTTVIRAAREYEQAHPR